MLPLVEAVLWFGVLLTLGLFVGLFIFSSASGTVKLLSFLGLVGFATYYRNSDAIGIFLPKLQHFLWVNRIKTLVLFSGLIYWFRKFQQKHRWARLDALMDKYNFTDNPKSFQKMSIQVAQEVEANIAEYEFPRLYQFAWISDFLRTATDPGVSRALIRSGHMVNPDPMIEHERLQATIHLMSAFMAYPLKSPTHSLVVARINEHHHRYGVWINSDDILYLIIHFAMVPGNWINRFGYRCLQPFEQHAIWVLWREIGCMMGLKYMPKSLEAAKSWRREFEKKCRWRCDENEQAGMAMLNEIVYSCPSIFKPILRKIVVSILDPDTVILLQMEKLGPSPWIRFIMFRIFEIIKMCSALILNFGFPRLTPYKRTFNVSAGNEPKIHVRHTPYDTLPFYQPRSFWNLYGFRAIIRTLLGLPSPSLNFYSEGTFIKSMGAAQVTSASQLTVEQKVREKAAELEASPPGYRPAIAYQAGRLLATVGYEEYGAEMNRFAADTPIIPSSDERFNKKYEQRGPGFSKIDAIEKPDDIVAFDESEAYPKKPDVGLVDS